MRHKQLRARRGVTEIGLILTAFAIVVLVIIPIANGILELFFYHNVCEQIREAVETTGFSLLTQMDADAYSEAVCAVRPAWAQLGEDWLCKALPEGILPLNLSISRLDTASVSIQFQFIYTTRFFLKHRIHKQVDVNLTYALPLDR